MSNSNLTTTTEAPASQRDSERGCPTGREFAPPVGTKIQVLWRIVYDEKDETNENTDTNEQNPDANVVERWWGATVQDCTTELVGSRLPAYAHLKVHVLLYDTYNEFTEETARVVFLPDNVLVDLSMLNETGGGRLDWQVESDKPMDDDDESTIRSAECLAREGDEIVQQCGLSTDADLQALATMPHDVQLHVASGYRSFADAVKRLLGELIANKPADYVVTAEDVQNIMARVRSQRQGQLATGATAL